MREPEDYSDYNEKAWAPLGHPAFNDELDDLSKTDEWWDNDDYEYERK